MQIKRFEAKTMTMALRMVKNELGSEAVILSARSLRKGKGIFSSMKYAGVEVTAAIDAHGTLGNTGRPVTAESISPNLQECSSNDCSRVKVQNAASVRDYAAQGPNFQRKHLPKHKVDSSSHWGLSALYQQLLSQGVQRGIASDLIDKIKRFPDFKYHFRNGELNRQLCSTIEEMGARADKNTLMSGKTKMVALLGSAGVGKTTTIAKLAAVQTNRKRKQVAVISIDNYGIAANEQLKTYARIIGIPLTTAVKPSELKRAIKKYKQKDLIFIDTPGINPTDPGQISELKSYFSPLPEMQKHLVVSVATKEKDLFKISQAFQEIGVQRLLFTKLDESSTYGNMLNVLIQTRIPLSFISYGRKVPDDIEAGSVEKLIDRILPAAGLNRRPARQSSLPTADPTPAIREPASKGTSFVANKNSDVYHSTDCKWSSKIKPGNIIRFASSQEAEAQNYLPCRSCSPKHSKKDNPSELKPAAQKLSSYQ